MQISDGNSKVRILKVQYKFVRDVSLYNKFNHGRNFITTPRQQIVNRLPQYSIVGWYGSQIITTVFSVYYLPFEWKVAEATMQIVPMLDMDETLGGHTVHSSWNYYFFWMPTLRLFHTPRRSSELKKNPFSQNPDFYSEMTSFWRNTDFCVNETWICTKLQVFMINGNYRLSMADTELYKRFQNYVRDSGLCHIRN